MLGKTLAIGLGFVLLLYGALLALLYFFQEALIFPGSSLPKDFEFRFDVPFGELDIPVTGGTLNALHFRQPHPTGVIFFLHGNGGNLDDWTENIEWYGRANYDLFIFDYRGYGKSPGRITSEQQLLDDVRAAWRTMRDSYNDIPIVIYGRSLGSALAARLASEVEADLVVLVSPFTSMRAMARLHYPFVPGALLRYPLRTDAIIGDIAQPLLLIHGSDDRFIPPQHSKTLLSLTPPETQLLIVEGAGHNDIHRFPAYLNRLSAALPR